MNNNELIVGRFYWVIPVLDPDTREEWEDGLQPARYAGKNADGHCLWNYIGIDGCTNWPVRWIGEEISAQAMAGY